LKILIEYWIFFFSFFFLNILLPTRNYCWFKKNWILIHL
jgi:hypothetical protein